MTTEAHVQQAVRLEYARRGYQLFRNNSGVLQSTEPVVITPAHIGKTLDVASGRPVRYGLANDSAQVNAVVKSSDLIGWHPVIITPGMVGHMIARFVSLECKPPGWHLTPGDKRGQAQKRWLDMVTRDGGEARFI